MGVPRSGSGLLIIAFGSLQPLHVPCRLDMSVLADLFEFGSTTTLHSCTMLFTISLIVLPHTLSLGLSRFCKIKMVQRFWLPRPT